MNLADPDGVTPLLMAILNSRFDTAAYLIGAGRRRQPLGYLGTRAALCGRGLEHDAARRPADRPSLDPTTAWR